CRGGRQVALARRFRLISQRIRRILMKVRSLVNRSANADTTPHRDSMNPMRKSTGTISLVLLGTALTLAGCSSQTEEKDEQRQGAGGHGGSAGTRFVPGFRGGGFAGTGTTSATPSVRGGFGGIGSVSAAS